MLKESRYKLNYEFKIMKKNLIFILLVFAVWQGYSQSLNYGFGLGLNNSSLVLKKFPEQNSNYKLGFQFNAILKYNFNDKFGISIEPGFANRGTILSSSGYSDTKINLNYLILPVTANYTLFDKFSILIGPECSYRISAKGKTDDNKSDLNSIYDSKIDFGVIAGLSYQIFDKLDIGFRYNRGFISAIKDLRFTDEYGNDKGKVSILNQGFTLSIAYMIK
jgi:opacity protein-like surface antigen